MPPFPYLSNLVIRLNLILVFCYVHSSSTGVLGLEVCQHSASEQVLLQKRSIKLTRSVIGSNHSLNVLTVGARGANPHGSIQTGTSVKLAAQKVGGQQKSRGREAFEVYEGIVTKLVTLHIACTGSRTSVVLSVAILAGGLFFLGLLCVCWSNVWIKGEEHSSNITSQSLGGNCTLQEDARDEDASSVDLCKRDGRCTMIGMATPRQVVDAPAQGTTLPATTFNLTSAILGAGGLSVPFAFRLFGWSMVGILAVCIFISLYTALLIVRCLDRAIEEVPQQVRDQEPVDWPLIGLAACGPTGQRLVQICFLCDLFFILMSLLVVNGNILHQFFPRFGKSYLIGFTGFMSWVLLFCSFQFLGYFSFLGLVAMGLTLAFMMVTGTKLSHYPDMSDYSSVNFANTSEVVGIALFCFTAHAAIPCIYARMAEKKAFPAVAALSFGVSGSVYILFGVIGYALFAMATRENVLANIGRNLDHSNIAGLEFMPRMASGLFAFKLQTTFPLYAAPVIGACEAAMKTSDASKIALRAAFMVFTTGLAVFLQDAMADCMAFTGCLFSMCTTVIFPCFFALTLFRNETATWEVLLLVSILLVATYFQVTGTVSVGRRILGW